jgi:hypothetical protein
VKSDPSAGATANWRALGQMNASADSAPEPVVILSYPYSGARLVQQALADGTDLACTAGTGLLPLCEVAAATWANIDNRPVKTMSRLAISSIRVLVSTQLSIVLSADKRRWCELAASTPGAAQTFLQIFPATRFICVHRASTDVIFAAIRAQPWGLAGPAMSRFTASYPGNSVAAVAAYWVSATEQLLTFEAANPQVTTRVRHEEVRADTQHALDSLRSSLRLNQQNRQQLPPELLDERDELAMDDQDGRHLRVPADMIPAELRKRIDHLHAQLGYPPVIG